jgi:hypothetical protein
MSRWSDFESAEPEMAAMGRALLKRHQVVYLATLRHHDAGPRVHQVCPAIAGGDIYVSIGPTSPKLRDLRRDGRYMLHFMCGEEDAEFNIRGSSHECSDPEELKHVRDDANAQGIRFTEHEVLFRLSIDLALTTVWERFGTPDITPVRRRWQSPDAR